MNLIRQGIPPGELVTREKTNGLSDLKVEISDDTSDCVEKIKALTDALKALKVAVDEFNKTEIVISINAA